jgi:hypothetical protein
VVLCCYSLVCGAKLEGELRISLAHSITWSVEFCSHSSLEQLGIELQTDAASFSPIFWLGLCIKHAETIHTFSITLRIKCIPLSDLSQPVCMCYEIGSREPTTHFHLQHILSGMCLPLGVHAQNLV